MEQVLVVVSGPLMIHVLQIAAAVNEDDRRAALLIIGGLKHVGRDLGAVARGDHHNGRILPGVLRELGRGRGGEPLEILLGAVLLYVEVGRLVGVRIDIGDEALVGRENGSVLAGSLGEAGERAAVTGHFVEELVGGAIGAGNQVELRLVPGLAHVEHLPIAVGERARFAGVERHGVELCVAGLFADKVDFAIVLHPAEGVGGTLRTADPGVVVDVDQYAGLAGGWIEGEDPAVFVIGGAGADDGLGSVLAPDGRAHLDIAVVGDGRAAASGGGFGACGFGAGGYRRGCGHPFLAVVHPLDFAGLHVEDGKARGALGVADIGPAGNVFGVDAVGDEVGDDGVLGGRGGRIENARDDVLFVRRELQRAHGLARQ